MKEQGPENLPVSHDIEDPNEGGLSETEVPEKIINQNPDDLKELAERERGNSLEAADEIARKLKTSANPENEEHTTAQREKKIREYQERHIPDRLREKKENGSLLNKVIALFVERRIERRGIENLPQEGPFLVVCNHFPPEIATLPLLATLKGYDTHVVSGQMNWEDFFLGWALKKIRGLSVPESLSHLSDREKDELLERMPEGFDKKQYRKLIAKERGESSENDNAARLKFIRESVALLSRGDVIVIYPEGIWLYDGDKRHPSRSETMYQGYEGIEVIGKQFEKLTGKELPIIPIAIYSKGGEAEKTTMDIGKPLILTENDSGLSGIDWCMAHVARFLPESQRGYYREMAEKLEGNA